MTEPDRMKLLVVDDLEENLIAMRAALRRLPVTVLTASSGREALELLGANDVALALIDVQMPEMDGFELAELMRGSTLTREVPIIFVTAAPHEPYRVFAGYEAGAVDFLFKPVDTHVLRSKCQVFVELHQRKRDLQRQLRWNELLTAAVGHDLRNPLNAMLLAGELLTADAKDDDQKRTLARLTRAGRRMARLIDDLADLARVRAAERIELARRGGVDLGEIAATMASELASSGGRQILVERTGNAVGRWDADRLVRVLSNLVAHALRHGDTHRPISVRVDGADDQVVLRVTSGGDLPAEAVPYVWDPFGSGAAGPEKPSLGLYLVREIVAAHGGSISVETGSGETSFVLRLPRG